MVKYCENSKRVEVKIYSDNSVLRIESLHPPIEIETIVLSNKATDYTHPMNQPINIRFDNFITKVELKNPNNRWQHDPDPMYTVNCPTLDTIGFKDRLHIDKNRLYSDFDPSSKEYPNTYANNSGDCTYRIYFGGCQLKISDATRVIFSKFYQQGCPKYEVACDNNCPSGYLKCDKAEYPGYCCIPCNEIKSGIAGITSRLRSINNG